MPGKIFLTSIGRNVLSEIIDNLGINPSSIVVGFIGTAGNASIDNSFVDEDRQALINAGFGLKELVIEGSGPDELRKKLKSVDIVFVAGGNTFYLLREFRRIGFGKIVKEFLSNGGHYVGSSAGSLVVGPDISVALGIDDHTKAEDLDTYEGLALVPFVPLPHYDDPWFKEKIDANLKTNIFLKKSGAKTVTLNEDEMVVVQYA